jgi:bromodomain-containing protein 7/9
MHYLTNRDDNSSDQQDNEKSVTIGNLCEGLQAGSYSMSSFSEDKKNKSKPMYYIENGPFSSNAPLYDTTYTSIPKEEVDFLMSIYGDEAAYQYALR